MAAINSIIFDMTNNMNVTKDIQQAIIQGQKNNIKIRLYFENEPFNYAWDVNNVFTRPDGSKSNNIPAVAKDGYFELTLRSWMTDIHGELKIATRIFISGEEYMAFDSVTLLVQESEMPSGDAITDTQYDAILGAVASKATQAEMGNTTGRVTDLEAEKVDRAGDTMSGDLDLDGNKLKNAKIDDGVADDDPVNKGQLDKKADKTTLQEAKDYTYSKVEIDNKDTTTLQEAKDYTYSKVEIDNKFDDVYSKEEIDIQLTEIKNQIPTITLGVLGEPASDSELVRYDGYGSYPIDVVEEVVGNYTYYKWDDKKWPFSEFSEVIDENGNVMIKIPKMYVRKVFDGSGVLIERYISNARLDGFELPEFFIDHDTGQELPFGLVAKYNGTNEGGVLVSKSGVAPQVSTTLATARTRAMANGVGYHLLDMHVKFLLETLYLIVFAHSNSDTLFPQGSDGTIQNNGILDDMEHHTGYTKGLDNYLMKFLGIENYFSNVRTQVDGVKIVDKEVFVADDYRNYNIDENTDNYLSIGTTAGDGQIKELGDMGIPLTVGGSVGSYYGDYLYSNPDYRTLYFGRSWVVNANHGLFYWLGNATLDYASSVFGVRLVKKATS